MFITLRQRLNPEGWSAFARGVVAYGSAEAVTRVVRLGSVFVVARQVSPEMLGTAALALSLFELVRVLGNVGIGQRIVVATDDELDSICNAAARLFWIVCASVMVLQIALGMLLWVAFDLGEVASMLATLSLVYLFMPAGLVRIFLAMREQRLGATARVAATQNIADACLTLALAIAWPSAWAIVLPKLLTAPVWLLMARATHSWTPAAGIRPASAGAFATFGPAVLGSEMLNAARLNADKVLIGALLGTEALGLYYFAFNAGLGITQAFVSACNIALFPHLARTGASEVDREFRRAFALGTLILIPVIIAQAMLAPFYVPVVFGDKWLVAAPHLAILAFAALPLFAGSMLGARLRATGRPLAETALMAAATLAALGGLALGAQSGLASACAGFGIGLATVFAIPTLQRLLPGQFPLVRISKGELT